MKKIFLVLAAIFMITAIYAQAELPFKSSTAKVMYNGKATLGLAATTSKISSPTVTGDWKNDVYEDVKDKDGKIVKRLKSRATDPKDVPMVTQAFQYLLFDYFANTGFFETVENVTAEDTEGLDFLLETELNDLSLDRDSEGYARCKKVGFSMKLTWLKSGEVVRSAYFDIGVGSQRYPNGIGSTQYYPEGFPQTELVEWITQEDEKTGTGGGLLGKALDKALTKEKAKDSFLYSDKNIFPVERIVKKIIIATTNSIYPPEVQSVDENGIIQLHSLGLDEKMVLDVVNVNFETVAEIAVYDVKDKIAYAKVDPLFKYADFKVKEGDSVKITDKDGRQAVKNIKKELKDAEKAAKTKAKADKKAKK